MWELVTYAALGAFFNSFIRGAFIDHYFKKYPKFGQLFLKLKLAKVGGGEITLRFTKPINAVAFGVAAYFTVHSYLFASLLAVAMMIGQAPALFHEDTDKHKANGDWLRWAQVVAERALVWVLPLMVVVTLFLNSKAAPWWLLAVPMMPLAYSVTWVQWKFNRWALAEALFGACLWAVLVLV